MRIAQIAPLYESVPPRLYGGTERVVSHLTEALVRLGHDVTLFASGDSRTSAKLVAAREQALRLDPDLSWDLPAHFAMLEEVREQADQFDVLHFHTDCLHMPLFRDIAHRTITTFHGRLDIKDLQPFLARFRQFPLVSISNDQRRPVAFANFVDTVHHGLPEDLCRFRPNPDGSYVAFLGRIAPEKGPDRAIAIARKAGLRLKIAAKVDRADEAYFRERIEPLLRDPLVEFVGEISDAEKSDFLGNALALLFPIDWPEPFGLVMIEAIACGTPVIAWPRGSVPEIVEHGVTGLIARDIDEAAVAVRQVGQLDRRRIRQVFETRFSVGAMARSYLRLYEQIRSADEREVATVSLPDAASIEAGPDGDAPILLPDHVSNRQEPTHPLV